MLKVLVTIYERRIFLSLNNLEGMTTHELAEMIRSTLTPDNLEHISTDTLAEMISNIVLVLRSLPNIPLGELNSLADKLGESKRESETNLKPYEVYKGISVHFYQEDGPDAWKASVDWYGRLANVNLEEGEKPTRETVIRAAHKLINLLEDARNNGVAWPESYFTRK
jgi:hypothetical protein